MSRYLWVFLIATVAIEMLGLVHMVNEGGGEWHVISALLRERLAVSYGLVQVLIGSLCPFLLLLLAIVPGVSPRWVSRLSGLAAILVLVQVFTMRWNVVVEGQLFSKRFRGFVDFTVPWGVAKA